MSTRCPTLPFLPGFTINSNLGRTNFKKNNFFETFHGIQMLTDKPETVGAKINVRYPSIYAKGEVTEIPSWIAFDQKVLTFDAYYQETLCEVRKAPYQIISCKIYFFLEDGTIKVTECKVDNSGRTAGKLINRTRISFPPPKEDQFYDIIDFNIGKEIELFGRVFKITNCDQFTRNFLNRLGIQVTDPINTPPDPYFIERKKQTDILYPRKPYKSDRSLAQFIKYDGQVLRFYGYWDNRGPEDGNLHHFQILYFLADDTITVLEEEQNNSGKSDISILVKRGKLPKFFTELQSLGSFDKSSLLNVVNGQYELDPLNCGLNNVEFYKDRDLAIGAAINVYGRKIILTDCDPFTRKYYNTKYGIDDFTPTETPPVEKPVEIVPIHKRKLPPWNGFGSFDDSAQSCYTIDLKSLSKDFKQFTELDKCGLDSKIFRFTAKLKSKIPDNCNRHFILSYYLSDNTLSIYEIAARASSIFLRRFPAKMPGQVKFPCDRPDYYLPHHMYVGATLDLLDSFTFVLVDADHYTLRYMELHSDKFPKSNIDTILQKVRAKLKPIYKDFVAHNLPKGSSFIDYDHLRDELCAIMGDDWTEHEMITIARHFSAVCRTEKFTRSYIRQIVLMELKKQLWDDLDRLKEYFYQWDSNKTGYLHQNEIRTLLKACRVPLDVEVIKHMLQFLAKNDKCEIEGNDLFNFLDRSHCPMPDLVPLNVKSELWWATEKDPPAGKLIDWCAFNKALQLEHIFEKPIVLHKSAEKIE